MALLADIVAGYAQRLATLSATDRDYVTEVAYRRLGLAISLHKIKNIGLPRHRQDLRPLVEDLNRVVEIVHRIMNISSLICFFAGFQ